MKSMRGPSFSKKVSIVVDSGMSWSHLSAFGHILLDKLHTSQQFGPTLFENAQMPIRCQSFLFQKSQNPEIRKSKNQLFVYCCVLGSLEQR